ncbi:MAG: hypothetical protein ACR5K2_00035 [Wolbachia sp.]
MLVKIGKIDQRSFRVIKLRIVKTTKNSNDESNIADVIEGILRKNPQFAILENMDLLLIFGSGFLMVLITVYKSLTNLVKGPTNLELDDMGLPKIEVRCMRARIKQTLKERCFVFRIEARIRRVCT